MEGHPLFNRLKKRYSHLKKWALHQQLTCFRVYEKDLTEYPFILDWYDGSVVVWIYDRKKDDTDALKEAFELEIIDIIKGVFSVQRDQIFIKTRGVQKGLQTQYKKLSKKNIIKTVQEFGHSFEVNVSDYLDTGIFLDHRNTRKWVQAHSLQKRVLNLFAYTGTFSVYAAIGGAYSTTTVDLNPTYSEWTRRNFKLNTIEEGSSHRILTDDVREFLKHEQSRKSYDLIICDPPTFSNSKRTALGHFSVDEDQSEIITLCLAILNSKGHLIFSTNSRGFKLKEAPYLSSCKIQELTPQSIPNDFQDKQIHRCWKFTKEG